MLLQNYHNDSEKIQLLNLLAEIRVLRNEMGGYIEHSYLNENTIIVKLTNGILKIKEQFLEQYGKKESGFDDKELKKLADGFVVSTMG